jgi:hypothetical protein
VLPTSLQLLAPQHLAKIGSSLVGGQIQENGSFLGIPLLILCVGITVRNWRKLWPVFVAMLAVTSWLLSLGPRLIVRGHAHALPFALPFHKIDRLPGIDNVLPVRFSLYVVFFAAILVAVGIDEARRRHVAHRSDPSYRPRWSAITGRVVVIATALGAVLSLLPAWPYVSYAVRINPTERPKGLAIIPTGSVVLTYPYPTTFYDAPMLWQALDGMRFRLLGGYALVPNRRGRATIYPVRIEPSVVQAMLINSVSPVTVPGLPVAVAARETVTARSITVDRDGVTGPTGAATTVRGVVIGVDRPTGTIYIRHGYSPVAIRVTSATKYIERWAKVPSAAGVVAGEMISVSGTIGPGTITPTLVVQLRAFLRHARVQAVIVGLGTTDGSVVASWFRDALGPPIRAGGGAEIWTNVEASDRHGA